MILRAATAEDAAAMAAVHIAAMRTLTFLPQLHTVEEATGWMAGEVLPKSQAWIAEADGQVAGYIVFTDEWINQLYVRPERHGQGAGSALLTKVMADGRMRRLWTFQQSRARKFYEDRGFVAVEFTDGAGNEEKTPDVCYEWRPRSCPGV